MTKPLPTVADAFLVARAHLPGLRFDLARIETHDMGWIFLPDAPDEEREGGSVLFVPKSGAPPQRMANAENGTEAMWAFLRGGDIRARPAPEVRITAAAPDARRDAAAHAVHAATGLAQGAARQQLALCMAGAEATLSTRSVGDAELLVLRLLDAGFHCHVVYRVPPGAKR